MESHTKAITCFGIAVLLFAASGCAKTQPRRDKVFIPDARPQTSRETYPGSSFNEETQSFQGFLNVFHRGRQYEKNAQYDEAIQAYQEAYQVGINNGFVGNPDRCMALLATAELYEKINNLERSIEYWEKLANETKSIAPAASAGQRAHAEALRKKLAERQNSLTL